MYADRELAELASRKVVLQARITVRRMECQLAAMHIARPLAFIDRVWARWKQLSPWVKMLGLPLGFVAVRKLTRGRGGGTSKGKLTALLGALPVVLEAWKGFRAHARSGAMR